MAEEQQEPKKEARPPREGGRGAQGGGPRGAGPRRGRPGGGLRGGEGGGARGEPGGDRGDRRGFDRGRPEGPPESELEKLISDSLYLENQAHSIVRRMRDMG